MILITSKQILIITWIKLNKFKAMNFQIKIILLRLTNELKLLLENTLIYYW